MRKHYLLWLLAALLVPIGAKAQETLTVADGTATNGYVPIYGFYTDAYLHAQMIYPAEMLDDMTGGAITELVWYLLSPAENAWGVNVVVSMAEVDNESFSSGVFNTAELTEVWSGNVDGTDQTLDLELAEPYVYQGGNLLIDVYTTTEGTYSSCTWAGVAQTGGSVSGYNYNSTNVTSLTVRNFLPKATFTYSPGGDICYKPGNLTLDEATTESLAFHWTQRNDASTPFEISIDGTVVEPTWTDTFYTATGLNHSTPYTVQVRSLCSTESTSGYATVVMRTQCAAITEFPYNTSFEGDNLDCWIVPANDYWGILNNPSFAYEGNSALFHENYDGYNYSTANSYIISPEIVVPDDATDMELSWFGRVYGNQLYQEPGSYEVLISTTADTVINDSYEVVLSLDSISNGNYIRQSIMLEDYAGQTIRLAFHHTSATYTALWRYLIIDNLAIQNMNRPMVHIGRYSYRHGSTEANVMVTEQATFEAWLTSGSENNLQYYWTSARADAGEATLTASGDVVTMVYDVYGKDTLTLEAVNDAGSSSVSLVVNIDTFNLATLPFFCGFNSEAEYAPWVLFSLDSTVLSGYGLFTPAYAGSNAAGSFALTDGAQTDVMLVSPAIAVPENVGNMSLIYHAAGFVYDDDTTHPATYDVLVSNSGRSSYIYFTDTILHDTVYQNAYEDRNLNLNGYAGDTIYLAFRHTSLGAQGLVIDEIEIREAAFPVIDVDYTATVMVEDTVTYTAIMTEGLTEGATYTWTSTMLAANLANNLTSDADSIFLLSYTAAGIDTVKVVVTNSFGSDSMMFVVTVRDFRNAAAVPYATSFGTEDDTAWFFSQNSLWYIDTAVAHTGAYSLYASSDTGATNATSSISSYSCAIRAINFTEVGEYAANFAWHAYGTSYYNDYLRVFLAPISYNYDSYGGGASYSYLPVGCIALDVEEGSSYPLYSSNGWDSVNKTFNIEEPGTYLLVCMWRNYYGCDTAGAIDDISITPLSCSRPENLVFDSIDETVLSFHWTPRNSEEAWEVSVGDSIIEVVTDTFYTASDLTSSTAYQVNVRAICGEGDTSFALTATQRTSCGVITSLPWLEDFEVAGNEDCWTLIDADGNNTTWYRNTSGYLYGPYNSAGPDDWAITPAIVIPDDAEGLILSWDVYGNNYNGLDNFYQVLASTTDTLTTDAFSDTLFSESYPTTAWATRTVAISQYVGQTVRFAFRHVNTGDDDGMRIDNVGVRTSLVPMVSIEGPAFVNISDTSATFIANLIEGSTTGLTYTWSSTMETAGNATVSATDSALTISYTSTGVDEITVIATNNHGADTATINVLIVDLTPATLPYTTGFEATDDINWLLLNGANAWAVGSAASNGGTNALYISDDGGASQGYNLNIASYSYASRTFTVSEDTTCAISYDWMNVGESNYDYLRAFIAPASMTFTANTATTNLATSTIPTGCLPIDGGSAQYSSTWQTQTAQVALEAGEWQLVFYWRNDASVSSGLPAAIDNIAIVFDTAAITDTTGPGPQPQPCNAPTITAATATDATVTMVWTGSANSYEVAIVEGTWTAPANGTAAAGPSYTFTGLQASTQYTVGVRAICDDTASTWAIRSMTTAAAPGDTTDTTGIRLADMAAFSLYPNPATSTVTVDLGSESTALVAIIDQSGRKSGEWKVENGKLEVNVSDMAKGAYFVRVTTATGTSVRKLIVK